MRPIRACRPALYPQSIVGFAGLRVCGLCGVFGDLAVLVGRARRQRQLLPERVMCGVWRCCGT